MMIIIRYLALALVIVLALVWNAPAILRALLGAAWAVVFVMGLAVFQETGGILKGFALLGLDGLILLAKFINWLFRLKP